MEEHKCIFRNTAAAHFGGVIIFQNTLIKTTSNTPNFCLKSSKAIWEVKCFSVELKQINVALTSMLESLKILLRRAEHVWDQM